MPLGVGDAHEKAVRNWDINVRHRAVHEVHGHAVPTRRARWKRSRFARWSGRHIENHLGRWVRAATNGEEDRDQGQTHPTTLLRGPSACMVALWRTAIFPAHTTRWPRATSP